MFRSLHDRSSYYKRNLLCLFFIAVLVLCTASEKPELKLFSFQGFGSSNSIASPEDVFCDILANESAGYSVVKCISYGKSAIGKPAGTGMTPAYALINSLFVLIGTFVLYRIYFYRLVFTSHSLIIAYIHDLDGMKP